MFAFLDGDVAQDFVFLPQLLQDFIASEVRTAFFAELRAVARVFCLLLHVGLVGRDGARWYLLDGLIGVERGVFVLEGGHIFVNFLEGFFHFDFRACQHLH